MEGTANMEPTPMSRAAKRATPNETPSIHVSEAADSRFPETISGAQEFARLVAADVSELAPGLSFDLDIAVDPESKDPELLLLVGNYPPGSFAQLDQRLSDSVSRRRRELGLVVAPFVALPRA